MEKWSYLFFLFFQNICSYCSSNPSALLSFSLGVDSPHTNIRCHWNQLMPGQPTQSLMTISATRKQKCCSYKNHPNSCICKAHDTSNAMYQTHLMPAPMWRLTLNHHFATEQTPLLIKDRNTLSSAGKHILQNNSFFSDVSVLMTWRDLLNAF